MRFFEVEMLIKEAFPPGLGELVMSFLREPYVPWDSYDLWVPEYDQNGHYGHVPMSPIDLPMW